MTPDPTAHRTGHRAFLTGASGQDGYWLARHLLSEGTRVFGLVRPGGAAPMPGVVAVEGDLRDEKSLACAIDVAEPDEVYHLGAATFVPGSWTDPGLVEDINAGGTRRLLAAIGRCGAPMRFCFASSAEIFGAPAGRPQDENTQVAPVTPYGETKAAAHQAVLCAREEDGRFACSAILFNHESPQRPPWFVTRKIALAAARIARGLETSVTLGGLNAARDWGYAPEYMIAMQRMIRAEAARDYVVATGRAITVAEFARVAFERVGLDWRRHVVSDPSLERDNDREARIGDPSRIGRELGWKARTTVEELACLMVDADLARIDGGAEG